jgi:deoxyribodipyrimidine photo-lyase
MRLCTMKFTYRLFRVGGFKDAGGATEDSSGSDGAKKWRSAATGSDTPDVASIIERFNAGTTGMGLIDASQRELMHTGYTSNRARQNVAGFLAKHLGIDWRYGAEWYEMLLVDYDVCSNWANWQYVSGVGNDPRGDDRIFNPVKQAFDYDPAGNYVRTWVPEIAKLSKLENLFQAWTASEDELTELGLAGNIMVTDPVKRIEFSVNGKPRNPRRPFFRRRGQGRSQKSDDDGQPSENPSSADGHSDHSPAQADPTVPPRRSTAWRNKPTEGNGNTPHRGGSYRGGRGHRESRGTSSSRGFGGGWYRGRGGSRGGHVMLPQAIHPSGTTYVYTPDA